MRIGLVCLFTASLSGSLAASDIGPECLRVPPTTPDLCQVVSGLATDPQACALCHGRGFDLLSLTWEDTARSKSSCWGPNISDLTIQVLSAHGGSACQSYMPVIRRPNFTDVSCDVAISHLKLLVGNERGGSLHAIDLESYLRDFAAYQHAPTGSVTGSLLSERDHAILVSAQACILPVSQGDTTSFAPVLFNYQARSHDPTVLVIMATPEGTSAQVMSANAAASSGVTHGQRLFHNRNGERAVLQAQRWSDYRADDTRTAAPGDDAHAAGLSMVLIIQVPLLQRQAAETQVPMAPPAVAACAPMDAEMNCQKSGGLESAVISSGTVEGAWIGLDHCSIQRDPRFPIRATVQFYQASSYAGLAQADVDRVGAAIDHIYLDADAVGSLVVSGHTDRATEPQLLPQWPRPWWEAICLEYTRRSGEPWSQAIDRLHQRLGQDWQPQTAQELRNALILVQP